MNISEFAKKYINWCWAGIGSQSFIPLTSDSILVIHSDQIPDTGIAKFYLIRDFNKDLVEIDFVGSINDTVTCRNYYADKTSFDHTAHVRAVNLEVKRKVFRSYHQHALAALNELLFSSGPATRRLAKTIIEDNEAERDGAI